MKKNFEFIDLTHTLHEGVPTWNGSCGFNSEVKLDYPQGCRVQNYKMHAGIGTHMDAPSHFYPNGSHIADIPLDQLITDVCIIDVSLKMAPDLLIQPEDMEIFEERFGLIPAGSFVIGFTGWSRKWQDPKAYRNPDSQGKMHFPGFHAQTAKELLKRNICGIGIDTLSPDGSTNGFPVHEHILGAGKYIIENLTNLEKMPVRGAYIINLPIKVKEGTEAAIRSVGLIPI